MFHKPAIALVNGSRAMPREADVISSGADQPEMFLRRIVVPVGPRLVLLRVEQVVWFEAQGKYVRVYSESASHLIRHTMQALESKLEPARFLRVSRSAILNIDHIVHLERWSPKEWVFTMRSGHKVHSTERYRLAVQRVLRGE